MEAPKIQSTGTTNPKKNIPAGSGRERHPAEPSQKGDLTAEQATATPIRDMLARMTADSIEAISLDPETLMLVRVPALVAPRAGPLEDPGSTERGDRETAGGAGERRPDRVTWCLRMSVKLGAAVDPRRISGGKHVVGKWRRRNLVRVHGADGAGHLGLSFAASGHKWNHCDGGRRPRAGS